MCEWKLINPIIKVTSFQSTYKCTTIWCNALTLTRNFPLIDFIRWYSISCALMIFLTLLNKSYSSSSWLTYFAVILLLIRIYYECIHPHLECFHFLFWRILYYGYYCFLVFALHCKISNKPMVSNLEGDRKTHTEREREPNEQIIF